VAESPPSDSPSAEGSDDEGRVRLDRRPVHLRPLSNEVSSIPPKERVY
jgi:hypothetical protein